MSSTIAAASRGLSKRGYWIRFDDRDLDAAAVRRELTMVPFVPGAAAGPAGRGGPAFATTQPPVSFALWRESSKRMYLPKCYGLARFGQVPLEAMAAGVQAMAPASLNFAGSLRPEQAAPVDAFLRAAEDPVRTGGILSLPCGFGKTVIALSIVSALKVRTMVVVHKEFLLLQWRERISQFLPDASVGLIKAKTVDVEGRDVVLASLQSLSMKEYDDSVFDGIGFLIVDECHRIGTEVFSRALVNRAFRYTLGISATVNRKDGMTVAFAHFLGPIVFEARREQDRAVSVLSLEFDSADAAYCDEPLIRSTGKPNYSRMVNNVTDFEPRNLEIVAAIVALLRWQDERRVLVLSDRKSQLRRLREGLEASGVTAGFYWGGMRGPELAESEACQVMLATFAYAAEGMDVPGLDTLVLASPKSDIEQSVGRILRLKPEQRRRAPVVVDVLDRFSIFAHQCRKRRAFFKKQGYENVSTLEKLTAERDAR